MVKMWHSASGIPLPGQDRLLGGVHAADRRAIRVGLIARSDALEPGDAAGDGAVRNAAHDAFRRPGARRQPLVLHRGDDVRECGRSPARAAALGSNGWNPIARMTAPTAISSSARPRFEIDGLGGADLLAAPAVVAGGRLLAGGRRCWGSIAAPTCRSPCVCDRPSWKPAGPLLRANLGAAPAIDAAGRVDEGRMLAQADAEIAGLAVARQQFGRGQDRDVGMPVVVEQSRA